MIGPQDKTTIRQRHNLNPSFSKWTSIWPQKYFCSFIENESFNNSEPTICIYRRSPNKQLLNHYSDLIDQGSLLQFEKKTFISWLSYFTNYENELQDLSKFRAKNLKDLKGKTT